MATDGGPARYSTALFFTLKKKKKKNSEASSGYEVIRKERDHKSIRKKVSSAYSDQGFGLRDIELAKSKHAQVSPAISSLARLGPETHRSRVIYLTSLRRSMAKLPSESGFLLLSVQWLFRWTRPLPSHSRLLFLFASFFYEVIKIMKG